MGISASKYGLYKENPEEFIINVSKLINSQLSSTIIKNIQYNILDDTYDNTLFTQTSDSAKTNDQFLLDNADKSIYSYVKADSKIEVTFKEALEEHEDVKVYAKLPSEFKIATPVGDYNPDWAIAFKNDNIKHIYFVAETKGSLNSLDFRDNEKAKIECARKHFKELKELGKIKDDHIYNVVTSYEDLLKEVKG
jgi:type III restriction enzyme